MRDWDLGFSPNRGSPKTSVPPSACQPISLEVGTWLRVGFRLKG